MTDTNTLAPCPFCGERAETDFIPEHHSYQIECSDSIGCTARITRDSELGAIEAWNCRAALAAPAQVVPAPGVDAVSEREFKQFLSDVITAAGLVTHGKKCKDLGRRLGEMSMRLRTAPKTAAAPAGMEPVAWLIVRSAFRASPDGQDAEGHEWLEEAQSPEEPGAFAVFTATQVQDALKKVCAIAVSAAKTNSRDIADWREDMDRIAAIAAQEGGAA